MKNLFTNNMKQKELKIQIPKGYEIDKENSTFEKIVFKKKKQVNTWEDLDLDSIKGVWINADSKMIYIDKVFENKSTNKNVFRTETYAKSALALAQISQLLPYYDANVDWNRLGETKYCIYYDVSRRSLLIDKFVYMIQLLAFNTEAEAKRFLKNNLQLVKDYYMIED